MKTLLTSMAVLATGGQLVAQVASIDSLEVSPGAIFNLGRVADSGVFRVSAPPYPLNVSLGIGWLVNPAPASAFVLHTPGGTATVTYHFDRPATVDQLEIIEHFNGVSKVEGFVGNDLGSLVSIGDIYSQAGDVNEPDGFTDNTPYVFDFNNTTPGTYFRFVTTEIVLQSSSAWAIYQAFPRTADGTRIEGAIVPEPRECALIAGLGLAGFAMWRRRAAK